MQCRRLSWIRTLKLKSGRQEMMKSEPDRQVAQADIFGRDWRVVLREGE